MDRLFRQTRNQFTKTMTTVEASAAFQRFVAVRRIAHANIDFLRGAYSAYRANGGAALPFAVRTHNGMVYIYTNLSDDKSLALGDQLVTLNEQPIEQLLVALAKNVSTDTDYLAQALMERQFGVLLWLHLGAVDTFTLRISTTRETFRMLSLAALFRAAMQTHASEALPALDIDPSNALPMFSQIVQLCCGPMCL